MIEEDGTTGPLPLLVNSADVAPQNLTLSGISSNPALVPTTNIFFSGCGANRTVTVVPLPNRSGTTTITVVVSDGITNATLAFERLARLREEHGYTLVHPFDDRFVIAGAGTATWELLEDVPDLDTA